MNEITIEVLDELIKQKNVTQLRLIFEEYNSVDLAEKINELDIKKTIFIFKTVPAHLTAEVFSYLDNDYKENLVSVLTSKNIKEVVEELYTDDIVDFIEEMPSNIVKKVLKSIDKELRGEVNKLLSYKENSAGSIMNIEYVELKESDTCKTSLKKIRKDGREAETISYCYIVDNKRTLKGYISLKEILFNEEDVKIKDIMEKDIISVKVDEDKEEVANTFKKYDLSSIAVTNSEMKMLGIITSDDIIDVIDDEATEDIEKMAHVVPLEDDYFDVPNFQMFKKTVVWLIILLCTSVLSAFILSKAESTIAAVAVLTVFMPMITGTAGNAGSQTTALLIRGLSLGTIKTKDFLKALRKEIAVGILVGGSLAIVCYGFLWVEKLIGIVDVNQNANYVFIAVSISLMLVVIVAKIIATTLPILAKLCKLDPAVMAGPLVTTLADAISILIYFTIAKEFLVPLF
jgi:magnesium transporter